MKKILIIGFIGFVSYSFAQSDEATKNLQKEADKLKAEAEKKKKELEGIMFSTFSAFPINRLSTDVVLSPNKSLHRRKLWLSNILLFRIGEVGW